MSTLAQPIAGIEKIDALTKLYAAARTNLEDDVAGLQRELEQVRNRRMRKIVADSKIAADVQAELRAALEAAPELFVKPRTITLHGIKVGYQKGKGRIECLDEKKTIERILNSDDLIDGKIAEELVETIYKLRRDPMLELTVGTLKKLGCTIAGTEDAVVIKVATPEVEKFVAKLLEEGAKAIEES